MMSERFPIHFSNFDVFNNDKFIINIYGYTFNWYGKDEKYTLSIYDSDKLNLLLRRIIIQILDIKKLVTIYLRNFMIMRRYFIIMRKKIKLNI